MRHHVVITGTGRSGTSFLVQLMTNLGLDTGFDKDTARSILGTEGRAGLEFDIRKNNCPYIVKSPWFCDYASDVLRDPEIRVDRVFIPIRDLEAAAESRRCVTRLNSTKGGLWHTDSLQPGDQEQVLLLQVYKLVLALSSYHIPVAFIRYPKLIKAPSYLFRKLRPLLKDMALDDFLEVFNETVCPELVHRFNKNDC